MTEPRNTNGLFSASAGATASLNPSLDALRLYEASRVSDSGCRCTFAPCQFDTLLSTVGSTVGFVDGKRDAYADGASKRLDHPCWRVKPRVTVCYRAANVAVGFHPVLGAAQPPLAYLGSLTVLPANPTYYVLSAVTPRVGTLVTLYVVSRAFGLHTEYASSSSSSSIINRIGLL